MTFALDGGAHIGTGMVAVVVIGVAVADAVAVDTDMSARQDIVAVVAGVDDEMVDIVPASMDGSVAVAVAGCGSDVADDVVGTDAIVVLGQLEREQKEGAHYRDPEVQYSRSRPDSTA